ncbi:MAG: 4Fe-4S binding protein [Clostridia bacterium]|nr:4Fe-4S binding protein [Clostridia bacterium]
MNYDRNAFVKCTVPAPEVARLKGLGCLRDKTTPDAFNCRVLTRNGRISAEEMHAIADAAARFGNGKIAFTTRQTAEVQGVRFDQVNDMIAFLDAAGLSIGGTGPRVRPIVSCKGTTCVFGLCDTYALSEKIHHLYYVGYHDVKLPHKFKIAVGGCPNNCVKPDLNDVGIIGQRVPVPNAALCRGCGACVRACPIHVAELKDKKYTHSVECNRCGRCVAACPFGALDAVDGYKMTLGGRWGKQVARGQALTHLFTAADEVLCAVEKAILLFRDKGVAGERFADTLARIGMEEAERLILSDELLLRKDEILAKAL